MEALRQLTVNGQELSQEDVNEISFGQALAPDRVVQELFRVPPVTSGGVVAKGVVPYGLSQMSATDAANAGIVKSTGSTSPSLHVYPFRAIVGSTARVPAVSPLETWRDSRSVIVAGQDSGGLILPWPVNINGTVSNNRVDLVYCKITINAVSVNDARYVRDSVTKVITHPSLDVERADTYDILVAAGVEATTPTAPALPADSGFDYYIPLAYVYQANPGSGFIATTHIHEIAPVVMMSAASGAATAQPGSQQYKAGGSILGATPFTPTTRPDGYMPPTMVGKEERYFYFSWDGTPKSPTVGTTHVIDDTRDWRKRIFKWFAKARSNSGAARPPWNASASVMVPQAPFLATTFGSDQQWGMGQSFQDDGTATAGLAGGLVCYVGSTNISTLASTVNVYVDMTTGNLMVSTASDPGVEFFLWVEASGQFTNAS